MRTEREDPLGSQPEGAPAPPGSAGLPHESGPSSKPVRQGSHRPWVLAGVGVLHALVFTSAAMLLPWRHYALFALLTGTLALGHAAVVVGALTQAPWFCRVWRAIGWVSLAWLGVLTWSVATSALYMLKIYGTLGSGIAAALLIGWCIPVLFTIPFAGWALAGTRPARRRASPHKLRPISAGVLLLAGLTAASWHKLAYARTDSVPLAEQSLTRLSPLLLQRFPRAQELEQVPGRAAASLEPIRCPRALDANELTFFLHYTTRSKAKSAPEAVARCIQASTPEDAVEQMAGMVRADAVRAPIKLDLITGTSPLTSGDPLLDGFRVRPGLDGVCDGKRCLLGWQLTARHLLNEHAPIGAIPELRMGLSPARVREALGSPVEHRLDGLTRITTASFIFENQLTRLTRMHRERQALTTRTVKRASRLAERHIARALERDGRYRYQLYPFSGVLDTEGYNLPRQAGTTLALCEFATQSTVRTTAKRALAQMAGLEVKSGEKSFLMVPPEARLASLGNQTLPLVAFLVCRKSLGSSHDELIGRLATTLLSMQREAGDFYPEWDISRYAPGAGPPPLFSPGQAVMALVLLERVIQKSPGRPFPSLSRVRGAAERAMRYYGGPYWDFPLGPLFYVEENWHCLAARAALGQHRVDAYENFCIRHAEFKARFIVGEESPTADMQGAFALAPLIPPPNAATAGLGEALAAAITLKRARGENTERDEQLLRRLLTFLLRQQWDRTTCFACKEPDLVAGGFSDSMLTPTLRIDFTQHAWAAIMHGSSLLGLSGPARMP